MAEKPTDFNIKLFLRDMLAPNRYRLDTRFVLRDGKRHPFAVICPGGGYWMVCSFVEGIPIAKKLNEMGYSAFILRYRTRKKAMFPAPQDDLARAIREILQKKDKYCIDPSGYSVWGFSAGGHLAASFGTEHMGYVKYGVPKPTALVLSYPVISMRKELTHQGSKDNLLGKETTLEAEALASVDEHVTAAYPPTYIWCGDTDKTVPPDNTKNMAVALEKAGVPYGCDIFPGVDHGVGLATGTAAEDWIQKAVDFWQQYTNL